jgi:catechol 2,3-dioxygenase-like lactoylglutathione lyase family enzyme
LDPHEQIDDDGRFAAVRLGSGLTIDLFDFPRIEPVHVAFVADDAAFDGIVRRLRSHGVPYGSQPNDPANGRTDHPLVERELFFRAPDGHLFEVMASPMEAKAR